MRTKAELSDSSWNPIRDSTGQCAVNKSSPSDVSEMEADDGSGSSGLLPEEDDSVVPIRRSSADISV
jgi:hypothetical protein